MAKNKKSKETKIEEKEEKIVEKSEEIEKPIEVVKETKTKKSKTIADDLDNVLGIDNKSEKIPEFMSSKDNPFGNDVPDFMKTSEKSKKDEKKEIPDYLKY